MSGLRRVSFLILLGATAFLCAFAIQRWRNAKASSRLAIPAAELSDSAKLAASGIYPGRQMIAYVFGSTRCGYCEEPSLKRAFSGLRDELRKDHKNQFAHVAVVGVAISSDFDEGMKYLREIGLDNLDEISVGQSWRNEHVISLIRYRKVADAGVPLVVVLERSLTARLTPFEENVGPDSVVAVAQGHDAILQWVHEGTPLRPYPLNDSLTKAPRR